MNYFRYEGYKFPVHLVDMTGGGVDTWDDISQYHQKMTKKYAPINKSHVVVEMGCGVGRDAIQIAKQISKKGRYIGLDIIRDSIIWCQQNISTKYPHFEFIYLDIKSQIHNPTGNQKTTDISLPIPDNSVDRIILHSVFTHMFEDDITHYLKEFRRILKPNGLILTSFFLIDDDTLKRARADKKNKLTFRYRYDKESLCYVNDKKFPEGAVGYYPRALSRMLAASGLTLAQPIHLGFWSNLENASNGQDVFILKPANRVRLFVNKRRPMAKTLN